MKKSLFTMLLAAMLLFSVSCTDDAEPNDTHTNVTDGGIIAGEVLHTTDKYTLTKASNGYALYQNSDNSLLNVYADYRMLSYYDENGEIKTNHVLIAQNGNYTATSLTDDGLVPLARDFVSYSFHGDYVVLGPELFDGSLKAIGLAYGAIESVDPLEDGGTVTFAERNGTAHSFFYMKRVETPTENVTVLGDNGLCSVFTADNELYLKSGDICYLLPIGIKDNILSVVCTETDSASVLYSVPDSNDKRVFELTPARVGSCAAYYQANDRIITSEAGAIGQYDIFRAYNATWLEDANGSFFGFDGTVNVVGDMLIHGLPGVTHTETYVLYDDELRELGKFDYVSILDDGSIIAKPKNKNEVVMFEKGEQTSNTTYERVLYLDTFGAAVAVGDEVRFISPDGKVLAKIGEYDSGLMLERIFTGWRSNLDGRDKQWHVAFTDPEQRNKDGAFYVFDFWYDPETGKSGMDVWN